MKKPWILVFGFFLAVARGELLDVDVTWEISAPEAWQRATDMNGKVRTYAYFPDGKDLVDATGVFFYDPDADPRHHSSVRGTRGISIMFAPEDLSVIIVEGGEPIKIELFGKQQPAYRYEYTSKKGRRFQYVFETKVHAFPNEQFGESDPVIISIICNSADEFSEFKKILETIRRKSQPHG
jgi:hypothetical protein